MTGEREPSEEESSLSPRERARLRRRERKRTTRMVVDNAGVKRLQQSIATRGTAKPKRKPPRGGQ